MNSTGAAIASTAKCSRWRTAILTIGTPIPGSSTTAAMEMNWRPAPFFYCRTVWGVYYGFIEKPGF